MSVPEESGVAPRAAGRLAKELPRTGVIDMNGATSLLQDLDDAIARGTDESRAKALWHATDILITGRYSDDEISMFGEVIGRLADEIEVAARTQLSELMSACDHALLNVIAKLALDDEIEVAGPVLRDSTRIDEKMLVESALTKGQAHLLAISQRQSIGEAVTDVLVKRGDQEVATSVARNEGARFSGSGLLHMVRRAEGDLDPCRAARPAQGRAAPHLPAAHLEGVGRRPPPARDRAAGDDGADPELGDRGHRRSAIQVRSVLAQLFRRQARGDDAVPAGQPQPGS